MAINKNFVVKNGIEVNTNLIVADTDSNKVGIGTTVPEYTLHVFEGAGIGVTNITVTGISTNLDELNVGVGGTTLTAISNATLGIGGSVGVGTDDPGYLLEVHSPVTSGQTALYVRGDMVVTGDINIDDISIGDLNVSGISTFVGNVIIGTGATVGFGSTAFFKDYAKAIFGDGEDLKVYHDGSNSYISDSGTGGLIVGSNSLTIKNAALNETQAVFTENGAVELYHDNGKRFNTNAIGVEVSGTLQSTGITTLASSGGITTTGGDLYVGGDLYINEDIVLDTNLNILGIATLGSIHVTGISTFDGDLRGPNLTNSIVVGTGLSVRGSATGVAVTLAGAGGITTTGGDLYVGGDLYINEDIVLDTNLTILGIATIGSLNLSNTSGINTIDSTVQSTSKDTGSLVLQGGLGVEKSVFIGDGLDVTGIGTFNGNSIDIANAVRHIGDPNTTIAFPSNDTVKIETAGTDQLIIGPTGIATFAGVIDANNTTQSSSSTTGSAQFAGGVGVAKNLYVGGGQVTVGIHTITDLRVGTQLAGQALVGITTILDEDNLASDSAAALATQQSIKAYVDAQVTASDLDFQGDSGGAQSVDLDSQTFTIAGTSNEIETSGSGQTLTVGLPNDVTIGNDLTVTNNVSIASSVFHTGDLNSAFGFPANDTFTVYTNGSERLRITSAGDMGLGTNSPTSFGPTFQVSGTDPALLLQDTATAVDYFGVNVTSGIAQLWYDDAAAFTINTATALAGSGLAEKLRITSGGEVLVGTVTDANIKLDVEGSLRAKAAAYVAPTSGVGLELYYATTTLNDTPTAYISSYDRDASAYKKINYDASDHKFRISGTEKLSIRSDGGVVATGIATFSSTAHLTVPVGTTAQRDSNVANGMIRYNTTLNSYEGYGNGAWGGLGGGTEIDTSVSTTTATNLIGNNFLSASYRSASMRIQITQGSSYQVGKYLLIHDGTTVTIVEESAIATGDMLGSISGAISGDYVQVKVSMNSASSATVTTIIDKITV